MTLSLCILKLKLFYLPISRVAKPVEKDPHNIVRNKFFFLSIQLSNTLAKDT